MKIDEKVAKCAIKHDTESHIRLNEDECEKCESRICTLACPAGLYTVEDGKVKFDHTGCLECGTCLVVCPRGAVDWSYPTPGFGIRYRFG